MSDFLQAARETAKKLYGVNPTPQQDLGESDFLQAARETAAKLYGSVTFDDEEAFAAGFAEAKRRGEPEYKPIDIFGENRIPERTPAMKPYVAPNELPTSSFMESSTLEGLAYGEAEAQKIADEEATILKKMETERTLRNIRAGQQYGEINEENLKNIMSDAEKAVADTLAETQDSSYKDFADAIPMTKADGSIQTPNSEELLEKEKIRSYFAKSEDGTYILPNGSRIYSDALLDKYIDTYYKQANHPILMQTDAQYRKNFIEDTYKMPYEEFISKQADTMQGELDKAQKTLYEARTADYAKAKEQGVPMQYQHMMVDPDIDDAQRYINDIKSQIDSFRKNGFWQGLKEGFNFEDTLMFGIPGIATDVEKLNALRKFAKGDKLTPAEQLFIDLSKLEQSVEDIRSAYRGDDKFSWNSVGNILGQAPEFMLQMALGGKIVPSIGKKFVEKATAKVIVDTFKKSFAKGLGMATKNIGANVATDALVTPLMGSTWKTFTEKRLQGYNWDGDKLNVSLNPVYSDMIGALGQNFAEVHSEKVGQWLTSGLGLLGLGRKLASTKFMNKVFGDVTHLLDYKMPPVLEKLRRDFRISGYLGEVGGEWYSSFLQAVGSGDWRELTSSKFYWELLTSTAMMTGSFYSMNIPSIVGYSREIKKLNKAQQAALNNIGNEDLKSSLVSAFAETNIDSGLDNLAHINWNDISSSDVKSASEYIFNRVNEILLRSESAETDRLSAFTPYLQNLVNNIYQGSNLEDAPLSTKMVLATMADGRTAFILNGDYEDLTNEGVIMGKYTDDDTSATLDKTEIRNIEEFDLSDRVAELYALMFSKSINKEKLNEYISSLQELRDAKATPEQIDNVLRKSGYIIYDIGDEVSLVDGTKGEINEYLGNGQYLVSLDEGVTVQCGFQDILQPDPAIAEAQVERNVEAEVEAIEQVTAVKDYEVGDTVRTSAGIDVVIRDRMPTGDYIVEDLQSEQSFTIKPADIVDLSESPKTEQPARPIPTDKDGNINFDAIDDAQLLAELLPEKSGGKEKAIDILRRQIASMQQALSSVKAPSTLNDELAQMEQIEQTKNKIKVYEEAIALLQPEPTESSEQSTKTEVKIDASKVQWDKLSPEEYAKTFEKVYGAPKTIERNYIYYNKSKEEFAKAKDRVAKQTEIVRSMERGLNSVASPIEEQALQAKIDKANQIKVQLEGDLDAIRKQMAKYAYAMKKYGVEVAAENDLLAEREKLNAERAALVEADKELDQAEADAEKNIKKTIPNTEANRKYIEQLYADRFGVSPAQAGPRQAILWDLANGAIKLRWDNVTTNSGAVQRGLQAELGVRGTEERRAYKAVIDNKNGQSVDAYVHDLWQNGEWGQEISTEELKDELLGVLQSTPNGSLALKELADMSGVQADLEAQISLGKGDIQRKLEEVDANLAKNAQQMADFRKRINDTVQKLENGEPLILPIGEGEFGPIYDQFKGKPQEAVNFLLEQENGFVQDVFMTDDLGGIGLIKGSDERKRGIAHMIAKHINRYSDFGSIEDMLSKVSHLIKSGERNFENEASVTISDGQYKILLGHRPEGWFIVTAYDDSRSQIDKKRNNTTSSTLPPEEIGGGKERLVSSNVASENKDTTSIPENQISEEEIFNTPPAPASEDLPFMIEQRPAEKPMDTAEQAFMRERVEILADVTGVKPHILNEKEFGEKLREIQSEIEAVRMSLIPKSTAPETALPEEDTSFKGTAISSADGAKILKNIDKTIDDYENKSNNTRNFIGDIAKALDIERIDRKSKYKTIEAKNGKVVSIRISDHNATVKNFDNRKENYGLSIVISRKDNEGISNNGNAHIVEYFYSDIELKRADGKPLVEILKSLKQALYSGEYKDTTGLAKREEVNNPRFAIEAYHGSGASFDKFDHSFMGTGEGAQAYGFGTYVTTSKGIAKGYADNLSNGQRRNYLASVIKKIEKELAIQEQSANPNKAYVSHLQSTLAKVLAEYELKGKANLYTVEVPDNTGENYLPWAEKPSSQMRDKLYPYFEKELIGRINKIKSGAKNRELNEQERSQLRVYEIELNDFRARKGFTGEEIYKTFVDFLRSPKAASEFLHSIGFTGIEYPAQYTTGGRADGAKNYVIFNADDVKIVEHVRYMKTPQGVIYGFTYNGETYIDGSELRPGVLIHEFTELWCEIVAESNPELWEEGKKLLRETDTYKAVMADPNYKNASEEAQYSETLSRITTAKAEKKMGTISDNKSLISKIRSWLRKFWGEVKSAFSKWNKKELKDLTIDQFTSMPLMDYFNGVDIRKYRKAKAQQAQENSLVGIHNISQEKLQKALKQGGLANPSAAVIDIAKQNHEGYGEYSLIMPKSLVDATSGRNAGTFTGDAWTPTYPTIVRQLDTKGWEIVKNKISTAVGDSKELYADIVNGVRNFLEDNRSSKLEYVFLKEKGIEPEIVYKGADGFVGIANLEAILGVSNITEGIEAYKRYQNAKPIYRYDFNRWASVNGNKAEFAKLKAQIKENPALKKDVDADLSFAQFDSFVNGIYKKEREAGNIDTSNTLLSASIYVDKNGLREEFESWIDTLMESAEAKEVFYAGIDRNGDRIYKPNTLENVSRHMLTEGMQNAYNNGGLSATKATLLQRLTTLSEIRQNKDRLSDEGKYNKEFDKLSDRLFNIITAISDMQEISSNRFMNTDYAEQRLQDALAKRDPIAYLNKEYGYDIEKDSDLAKEIKSFIGDVRKMPAKYFETKFERPVMFNEFAAVVAPDTMPESVEQQLRDAGLAIYKYNPDVEGDRRKATLAATASEDIRFMIVGEKGAAALDQAEEATTRLDNLAVAREMEEANRDAKAIKLATGWERGADGKWRHEIDDFKLKSDTALVKNVDNQIVTTLGEVIDDETLFTAFPELRKLSVVSLPNQEYGGYYQDDSIMSHIALGNKLFTPSTKRLVELEKEFDKDMTSEQEDALMSEFNAEVERAVAQPEFYTLVTSAAKKVLVHEVQHAIQRIEGFARGGSWEIERPDNDAEMLRLREAVRGARAYIDHFNGGDIAMAIRDGKKYNYLEWRTISPESQQILLEYLGRKRKVNYADFRAYLDNAHKMTLPKKYGMAGYRKFAGEVESKNAEARMYMTPEERRATLLSETEDVAREDQIFLENNLGVAQSVEVSEPIEAPTRKPRKSAAEVVDALSQKFGVPVEIITAENISQVPRRLRNRKGVYNASTNTVTIILPNNTDTADVEATYLHEVVGHYGLRKLLGDKFDTFLDGVWDNLRPEEQKSLTERYGDNTREVAEEFLANLAEGNVTPSLLDRIVGALRRSFRDTLGFDLSISEKDAIYMLYLSKNNLTSANSVLGKGSVVKSQKLTKDSLDKMFDGTLRSRLVFDAEGNLVEETTRKLSLREKVNSIRSSSAVAIERAKKNIVTNWVDTMRVIEDLHDELKALGVDITSIEDYHEAENLITSIAAQADAKFMRKYVEPLYDTLNIIEKQLGVNEENIEDYLLAKSSIERHGTISINEDGEEFEIKAYDDSSEPTGNWHRKLVYNIERSFNERLSNKREELFSKKGASKLTDAEKSVLGEELVSKFEREGWNSLTSEEKDRVIHSIEKVLWSQINAINRFGLNELKRGNIKSREGIDDILSHNWEYYVPMQNWAEDTYDDPMKIFDAEYTTVRRGGSSVYIHRAIGRKNKAYPPLPIMIRNARLCIQAAEKNRAKLHLYRLLTKSQVQLGKNVTDNMWRFTRTYEYYMPPENGQKGRWIKTDEVPSDAEIVAAKALNKEIRQLSKEIGALAVRLRDRGAVYSKDRRTFIMLPEVVEKRSVSQRIEDFSLMKEYDELTARMGDLRNQERIRWTNTTTDTIVFEGENPNTVAGTNAQRTVSIYVEGNKTDVVFRNPNLAAAINDIPVVQFNNKAVQKGVEVLGKFTRLNAAVNTAYNVSFVLTNPIRDFQQAQIMMYLDSENGEWRNLNKAFLRMFTGKEGSFGTIYRGIKGKANPLSIQELNGLNIFDASDRKTLTELYGKKRVNDTMFDYFMSSGGVTGFAAVLQLEKLHKEIKKSLMKESNAKGSKFIHYAKSSIKLLGDWISTGSEVLEIMTRYATFMANIYAGKPINRAVSEAKNITVNFNRRGRLTPMVSRLYVFANPNIQGLARILSVMTKPKNWFRTASVILGLIVLGALNYGLCYHFGGWDDDEVERPGAYVFRNNIVIPIPGTKKYIKIPLPHTFRMFVGWGVDIMRWYFGESDGWETSKEVGSSLAENMLFTYQNTDSEGDLRRAITPTPFVPYYDLARNADAFGRPIYKEDKFERGIPDSELGARNVDETLYSLTKWLNKLGGGTTSRPAGMRDDGSINPLLNMLDINPSKLEYLISYYTGGAGRELLGLGKTFKAGFSKDEEVEVRSIPVVNSFFGTEFTPSPSAQYYEDKEEITKYKAVLNREIKAGDINPKSSAVIGFYKRAAHFDRINKIISAINKELKNVDEADARYKELMEYRSRWQRNWNRIADVTDWEDKESVKKAEEMYKEYQAKDSVSKILNNK